MSYIFLSYAKADRESAFTMRDVLQNEGFLVWMDENAVELNMRHWETIQETIRNASAFVLLVSDEAKKSDWVERELNFAEENSVSVFPILIQGEGWARLEMETAHLGFGLNLDVPDEFSLRIKQATQNAPRVSLPPQIYLSSQEKKAARNKGALSLWLGVMTVIILVVMLLWPAFQNLIDNRLRENQLDADNTATAGYVDYEATATMIIMQASETAVIRSTESPRQTATSQFESARNETIGRVLNYATQAAEAEIAERNALATHVYQESMNLTAIAGNGVLPCEARGVEVNGVVDLEFYNNPNSGNSSWQLMRSASEAGGLTVIEWTVNEHGNWYRVLIQGFGSVAYYVRAESLVLDEDCPR